MSQQYHHSFPFRSARRLPTSLAVACAVVVLLASSSVVFAQTVAYWRFEEGGVGTQPADQGGVHGGSPTPILDSSGNGYNMGVLNSTKAPTYTSSVPSATVANSGLANTRALDFDGTDDDVYATGYVPGLNDYDFSGGWTIEAAFRLDTIPQRQPGNNPELPNEGAGHVHQGILVKDDNPAPNPNYDPTDPGSLPYKSEPPLAFHVRNDGDADDNKLTLNDTPHLEIRGLDGSGDDWNIDSRLETPLVENQWYYAAVVYNGTTTDLYLDYGNGYKWQNSTAMKTDGWYESAADWVLGRHAWNGNPTGPMDGQIDEVRISSAALSPMEFLNSNPADYENLVSYTIDPSQSYYTWSGTVQGAPMLEQQPGSLTAALGGTIVAHLEGNSLRFDDLSNIDMQAWGGPGFDPQLGSTVVTNNATVTYPTTGEDNIGIDVPALAGKIAIRDAQFGISDGTAEFGGPVTDLEVRTKSSRLDWYSHFFLLSDAGADLQGGGAGMNQATGNMTRDRDLVTGIETITIPVSFAVENDDFDASLGGQIVATRPWTGDFNNDGVVDGRDFLVYQLGYGTLFDDIDLTIWEQNFGMTIPLMGAGSAAVPEPSTLALVFMLGLLPLRPARYRRR